MFGTEKKRYTAEVSEVTYNMEQFAIKIYPNNLRNSYDIGILNEWCYENNCIPLNYKLEGSTIYAVVKRIKQ